MKGLPPLYVVGPPKTTYKPQILGIGDSGEGGKRAKSSQNLAGIFNGTLFI